MAKSCFLVVRCEREEERKKTFQTLSSRIYLTYGEALYVPKAKSGFTEPSSRQYLKKHTDSFVELGYILHF